MGKMRYNGRQNEFLEVFMFTIRDVREADREVLFQMETEFYSSPACDHTVPAQNFEATLQECLRSRQYTRILMLEDETGVVGYFNMSITWSNEAGGQTIWLEELFFRPQARDKGYGTRVFAWVEENYPNAKRYRLEATPANERAIALYRRLGYEGLDYYQMIKDR